MNVSPEIESLVPYKPGKPIAETKREYGVSQVFKLASNENALGPSPKALEAVQAALSQLHRYPDPGCHDLTAKLASKWELQPGQIAFGNGSNEIIDLLIRIFCRPGDRILTSQSAFVAYKICAQAAGVATLEAPLAAGYKIDLKAMDQILKSEKNLPKLVFFPNPNNPTGSYVPDSEVAAFLKDHGGREDLLFIFDEAYHEFVRAKDYCSGLKYINQYDNVMVMRTFSKVYGLAGLRVGALVGWPRYIDYYHRVRNPFNVNELAQVAAAAAIEDSAFLQRSQQLIWEGLDFFYKCFDEIGLKYIPSQANFVLVDLERDIAEVNEALLRRGVIARPVQPYGLKTHLRISVGEAVENRAAVEALREVLAQFPKIEG